MSLLLSQIGGAPPVTPTPRYRTMMGVGLSILLAFGLCKDVTNCYTLENNMEARYTVSVIKTGGPVAVAPIEMWVSDTSIGLQISLDDFIAGILTEVGSPALIMTREALSAKIRAASTTIISRMKDESRKAIA